MARKVSKIDDKDHPGHGFYAVEGMNGHYDEATAHRVAGQLDAGPPTSAPEHRQGATGDKPAEVSSDGSTVCPSCGHRFKLAGAANESDEGDGQPG